MNRPHILLVEDEPNIAQGLLFNLELEGYRVTHVTTGAEALARFADERCDLVILDLMLPDSHGLDICRQMRRRDKQRSRTTFSLTRTRSTENQRGIRSRDSLVFQLKAKKRRDASQDASLRLSN